MRIIITEGGKSWRNKIKRKPQKARRLLKTKAQKIANSNFKSSSYDPLGSYTGVGIDKYEKPIQDADDL